MGMCTCVDMNVTHVNTRPLTHTYKYIYIYICIHTHTRIRGPGSWGSLSDFILPSIAVVFSVAGIVAISLGQFRAPQSGCDAWTWW